MEKYASNTTREIRSECQAKVIFVLVGQFPLLSRRESIMVRLLPWVDLTPSLWQKTEARIIMRARPHAPIFRKLTKQVLHTRHPDYQF